MFEDKELDLPHFLQSGFYLLVVVLISNITISPNARENRC